MASVSGILMTKREPAPSVDWNSMMPPIFSMCCYVHTDTSTGNTGDGGGGREAGTEDELLYLLLGHRLELRFGRETVRHTSRGCGLSADRGHCRRPERRYVRLHGARTVRSCHVRASRRKAFADGFNAVIGGVPHHMGQRIADRLQYLAVSSLSAPKLMSSIFCRVPVSGRAPDGQFPPGISDRLHARHHHALCSSVVT